LDKVLVEFWTILDKFTFFNWTELDFFHFVGNSNFAV